MEQASLAIPGALISLLVHKAFNGPGPHNLGLLLGHVHRSTSLAVHDHSMQQHATLHVRFVVTDLLYLDFHRQPWFDALGNINRSVITNGLAQQQQHKHEPLAIVGLYSLRPGSATPSMRETKLWAQLIDLVASLTSPVRASSSSSLSTAGCVFFLGQHAMEPISTTPVTSSAAGSPISDGSSAAVAVPTVATWRQTCFHRYSSAASDDTSAFRIPIEIPNLLQSMGVGRHPPLVHAYSPELGRVFDVEQGVKRARDECVRGLKRVDELVQASSAVIM